MGLGKKVAIIATSLLLLGGSAAGFAQDRESPPRAKERVERTEPRRAQPRVQETRPREVPQGPRVRDTRPQRPDRDGGGQPPRTVPRDKTPSDPPPTARDTRNPNSRDYDRTYRHRIWRPAYTFGIHFGGSHHHGHFYRYHFHPWTHHCWEWTHYHAHHIHDYDRDMYSFKIAPIAGYENAEARVVRDGDNTHLLMELSDRIGGRVELVTLVDDEFDGDLDYGTVGHARFKFKARYPKNTVALEEEDIAHFDAHYRELYPTLKTRYLRVRR